MGREGLNLVSNKALPDFSLLSMLPVTITGLSHGSVPKCGLEGMIRGWGVAGDLHKPYGPWSLVSILILVPISFLQKWSLAIYSLTIPKRCYNCYSSCIISSGMVVVKSGCRRSLASTASTAIEL